VYYALRFFVFCEDVVFLFCLLCSALLTSPHVLIAEEEKIIFDDGGDPSTIQEK